MEEGDAYHPCNDTGRGPPISMLHYWKRYRLLTSRTFTMPRTHKQGGMYSKRNATAAYVTSTQYAPLVGLCHPPIPHTTLQSSSNFWEGKTAWCVWDVCTHRIGDTIVQRTRCHLRDIDPRNGLGDLWRRASEVLNGQCNNQPEVDFDGDASTHISTPTPTYQPTLGMNPKV